MLWSIGFIVGTSIAIPLLVGMLSKYIVLYPLNNHSIYLPFKLFPVLDRNTFSMAFCSGLVVAEVLPGILKYPSIIYNGIKQYSGASYIKNISKQKYNFKKLSLKKFNLKKLLTNFEAIIALTITLFLFSFFNFPIFSQILMIVLTIIAAYNISYIGGKIGLVPMGRFVTFVMIPTMLLFKLNSIQITILSVFVACSIATCADLIFGYKVGDLCNIENKKMHLYTWLGVIVTALSLGIIFWLLFTKLQLGSAELFAQRGKSRALLIQSFNFNWTVVFLGLMYGLILKKLRLSPTMVFGGILMPNGLTIGLLLGAICSHFAKNTEKHMPFFSGVFAGESVWIILSILTTII